MMSSPTLDRRVATLVTELPAVRKQVTPRASRALLRIKEYSSKILIFAKRRDIIMITLFYLS
jgi:hypothetical protein